MLSQYFLYILQCSDDSYYVGITSNLESRLKAHTNGKAVPYTAKRRPVRLVYREGFKNRTDAVKRERQVKGWSRAKKEALIKSDLETLRKLSKSK